MFLFILSVITVIVMGSAEDGEDSVPPPLNTQKSIH